MRLCKVFTLAVLNKQDAKKEKGEKKKKKDISERTTLTIYTRTHVLECAGKCPGGGKENIAQCAGNTAPSHCILNTHYQSAHYNAVSGDAGQAEFFIFFEAGQ